MANLKHWAGDRVVILITHRLTTIRDADHIAFLADGKVVESGTHDALIEQHGHYFDFVAKSEVERV